MPLASNNATLRLNVLLWMIGMPGVLGIILTTLPHLMRGQTGVPPLWIVAGVAVLQNGILLALAVWAGARLGPRVGLASPGLQALVTGKPALPYLRAALVAGLGAGALAGVALFAFTANAPAELAAAQARADIPLLWRVLYGGITEELLLRRGMMTVLVWLGWRFVQRGAGTPDAKWFWSAILVSAILFGIGHLPALAAQAGAISASLAIYVVLANAVFGLVAGYLYWRFGLEAAMIAHASAHVVAYLIKPF